MEYNEACKLARRIKRAFEAIPDDVIVTITSATIDISDRKEYEQYLAGKGHTDDPPTITSEPFKANVHGCDESL